jgi:hypothetical protein
MKKLLTNLSDWLLWLVVGILVVGLALAFGSIQRNADSAAPGTPLAIRTPTRAPYPPPDIPPIPPKITRIFPTPVLPITTTAQIKREQAIAKAMSYNPNNVTLEASGQLTVTATLTTWGEHSKQEITHSTFHPNLPVWVIELEMPPWKEWRGPVGQQEQLTFRGLVYVIDAVTGEILVPGSRLPAGEKK